MLLNVHYPCEILNWCLLFMRNDHLKYFIDWLNVKILLEEVFKILFVSLSAANIMN